MENKVLSINYDLAETIEQVSRERGWDYFFVLRIAEEYKKFMVLRSKNPDLSPSYIVDIFWHTHILNTKSYLDFCTTSFNKFVHHDPQDSIDVVKQKKRLNDTIRKYSYYFKGDIDEDIWVDVYPKSKYTGFKNSIFGITGATGPC